MSDYKQRHPQPDPAVWDAFCDMLDSAVPWVASGEPSPDPSLSGEQFAVGLLVTAIETLLIASERPESFVWVAQRLGTAWQNLRNDRDDTLLMKHGGAGRPRADQPIVWFRAEVLRLLDQIAPPASGRQRQAAQDIQRALREARAPKGCIPTGQTIRNWHGSAANPATPADRKLAEVRQSIEWSVPKGDTIEARVRWIIAEVARWPGRQP